MQRRADQSVADLKQCMPVRKFVRLETTPRHCHVWHQSTAIVIQTSQGRTLESSQEIGSSPAVAGTDLASKFRQTTALCLAADEPELLFGACDMNVKNMILNSRAPSTRNTVGQKSI